MNILITGGTGLVGRSLGIELVKRGHNLIALTRDKKDALLQAPFPAEWIECDISKAAPDLSSYSIDGVFHLAGESIGDSSWNAEQKEKIKNSRTQGTKNIAAAVKNQNAIKFFIGASAVGFYGSTDGDTAADETTPVGHGFLSEVTDAWEKESQLIKAARCVLFRLGVVLSTEGGAFPRMLFPARVFASSAIGPGTQWMSWIHLEDAVNALVFAMENSEVVGIYNLTAPETSQQKEFASEIAGQIHSLKGPPVPGFVLYAMLGEQASLALLSLRVSSEKLQQAGFYFKYPTLKKALENILHGWQDGASVKVFRQYFPKPRAEVFEFFSKAENLEKITPKFLNFQIVSMSHPKIQRGTLLDYKLKVRGIPFYWQTRIDTWNPSSDFTDSQTKGPYTLWHHAHHFEDLGAGTLMTDTVRYKVPIGLLGRMVTLSWVNNDLEEIFKFRRQTVVK